MSHYDSFIPVLRAVANIEKKGTINRAVNFPNRVMDNFLYMDLKEKYRLSDDLSVLEVFDYLNDCGGEFRDCELFRGQPAWSSSHNGKFSQNTAPDAYPLHR